MSHIVEEENISARMGAVCFEAAYFAEVKKTKWYNYRIGKSKVSLRVKASIDENEWTHYDVEFVVDRQKTKERFDDIPYAVKFLTAQIADIHRRNGYRVVRR